MRMATRKTANAVPQPRQSDERSAMTVSSSSAVKKGRKVAAARAGITPSVSRRWIVPSVTAVAFIAGGVGLVASPAGAAVSVGVIFVGGASHSYACSEGTTYHTGFPAKVHIIANNCGVRVWLHQNNNNTGVNSCFSPGQSYGVSNGVTYQNIYISNNNTNC
jgi:hypothetical protein